jgi:16S rRNA (guanine(1405)-N(7))-methyltransferase
MSTIDPQVQVILNAVLQKPKYSAIQPDLIARLAQRELDKGRKPKEAVKEVSSKLHQIGAAYFRLSPHYERWQAEITSLPANPEHENVRAFCLEVMQAHSSTAERLPILEDFFHETLAPIAPIESVVDLACGLNPLALPWLPLSRSAHYGGCDIFSDLVAFDNAFLNHFDIHAAIEPADIFTYPMQKPLQLALLLKSCPVWSNWRKATAGNCWMPFRRRPSWLPIPSAAWVEIERYAPDLLRSIRSPDSRQEVEDHALRFSSELAYLVQK